MEIGIDLSTLKDCTVLGAYQDVHVDGSCGSSAGALFVPFLAGGLGVAFSLPFLVAILKKEKESYI